MTYIKSGLNQKLNASVNVYYDASATISDNQPVTFANEYTAFNKSFTLSKSGAQFTLPNDSATYFLEASIVYWDSTAGNYNYAVTKWYDVTSSAYVGIAAINTPGLNVSEGRSGDIVADETAKHVVTGGNTYELRLKTTSGNLTGVDVPSGSLAYWYVKARCLIWRYA